MRRLLTLVAAALLVACEHPIEVVTPHAEAQDALVYDTTGRLMARTFDNRRWQGGPLEVRDRASLAVLVRFLDFQGAEFSIADRRDLQLRLETESDGVIAWEPLNGRGLMHALAPGTTRVRFLVWHNTHPDFITPWIPVSVSAP